MTETTSNISITGGKMWVCSMSIDGRSFGWMDRNGTCYTSDLHVRWQDMIPNDLVDTSIAGVCLLTALLIGVLLGRIWR